MRVRRGRAVVREQPRRRCRRPCIRAHPGEQLLCCCPAPLPPLPPLPFWPAAPTPPHRVGHAQEDVAGGGDHLPAGREAALRARWQGRGPAFGGLHGMGQPSQLCTCKPASTPNRPPARRQPPARRPQPHLSVSDDHRPHRQPRQERAGLEGQQEAAVGGGALREQQQRARARQAPRRAVAHALHHGVADAPRAAGVAVHVQAAHQLAARQAVGGRGGWVEHGCGARAACSP